MPGSKTTGKRGAQVVAEIKKWNKNIATQDRRKKYCKMAESPFIFYRGTAQLFWQDMSRDPRLKRFGNAKTRTWVQGDAHVENLGAFTNNKGKVVYGLNDFDEAIVQDYQFDLWRMATSIVLVARQNGGFSRKQQEQLVTTFAESYLKILMSYCGNDEENTVIYDKKNTYGPLKDFLTKDVEKDKGRKRQVKRWTLKAQGKRIFRLDLPDLEKIDAKTEKKIRNTVPAYGTTMHGRYKYDRNDFSVLDVARRLDAGTGSLGTPRYYVLAAQRRNGKKKYHILDIKKQSEPSAFPYLSRYAKGLYRSYFQNEAERHAIAYHAMHQFPDDFLGWVKLSDDFYSVRERSPYKKTFPTERLKTMRDFTKMVEQWGAILATQHAYADHSIEKDITKRTGGQPSARTKTMLSLVKKVAFHFDLDEEVGKLTDGNETAFCKLVREVAFEYADQVEADWNAFVEHLVS